MRKNLYIYFNIHLQLSRYIEAVSNKEPGNVLIKISQEVRISSFKTCVIFMFIKRCDVFCTLLLVSYRGCIKLCNSMSVPLVFVRDVPDTSIR